MKCLNCKRDFEVLTKEGFCEDCKWKKRLIFKNPAPKIPEIKQEEIKNENK